MSLVLDCSVTVAWVVSDERTGAIEAVFDRAIGGGAIVPALWLAEIANSLTVAVRRQRIGADFRDAAIEDLLQLGIAIDEPPTAATLKAIVRLADRHRLTIYDATYLELAVRTGSDLATLDRELASAARIENVAVLP